MKIVTRRSFIAVQPEFVAVRALGWQVDYRRWLPLGICTGRHTDWHVWKIGERRWITIGRVK